MFRFQRRWFYLHVPHWLCGQAFLYRGCSLTHSVKMARMGCAGWKGRAPGCFLPWQALWTPHILSAVPESPLWSPRWRYVLRGNIHLFLGSSLVPVGGNNPLSSPKSQLLVGKHAMVWCEHLWFGTIWWTQETLAWFNQYVAWKLVYESALLCYTWKNPPAKTVSCPLSSMSQGDLPPASPPNSCHQTLSRVLGEGQTAVSESIPLLTPISHLYSVGVMTLFGTSQVLVIWASVRSLSKTTPGKALNIPAWHFAQTPRIADTGLTAASSMSRSAGHGSPSVRAHSGWLQGREQVLVSGRPWSNLTSHSGPPSQITVPFDSPHRTNSTPEARGQSLVQREFPRGQQYWGDWGRAYWWSCINKVGERMSPGWLKSDPDFLHTKACPWW